MLSIAESLMIQMPLGATYELPRAGTALENPYVYDAAAREIKEHARRGRVEIIDEVVMRMEVEQIVSRLVFRRLR